MPWKACMQEMQEHLPACLRSDKFGWNPARQDPVAMRFATDAQLGRWSVLRIQPDS
jgi:hypothetical protein